MMLAIFTGACLPYGRSFGKYLFKLLVHSFTVVVLTKCGNSLCHLLGILLFYYSLESINGDFHKTGGLNFYHVYLRWWSLLFKAKRFQGPVL